MREGDARVGGGEHFEGEGVLRGDRDGGGEHRVFLAILQVREVDGAFAAAGEDGHHARGGAGVEEREEVVHGAHADVVAQRGEGVDAFVGFWAVRLARDSAASVGGRGTLAAGEGQVAGRHDDQVHLLLLAGDLAAYLVDVPDQGDLRLEEHEGALRVEALEVVEEGRRGALGPPDDVDFRCLCVFGKLSQGTLSGATCPANKQSDHSVLFRRKAGVGAADIFDVDHLRSRCESISRLSVLQDSRAR